MSNEKEDGASVLVPPALLFFGCLGVAYALHWLMPWQAVPSFGFGRVVVVVVVSAISFVFAAWGIWILKASGTTIEPGEPTSCIVETGPYRVSRNPLYVALVLLFFSFAVLVNSIWLFAFTLVLFSLLHFGVVLPEERYLKRQFGQSYLDYCQRVRRWL
jgi:protein-S-isoprenylcysteine O-methyltransferase Ste14